MLGQFCRCAGAFDCQSNLVLYGVLLGTVGWSTCETQQFGSITLDAQTVCIMLAQDGEPARQCDPPMFDRLYAFLGSEFQERERTRFQMLCGMAVGGFACSCSCFHVHVSFPSSFLYLLFPSLDPEGIRIKCFVPFGQLWFHCVQICHELSCFASAHLDLSVKYPAATPRVRKHS